MTKVIDTDKCTVCGEPSFAVALCPAHYHIRYKHLRIEWTSETRKIIARRLWGFRASLRLARLMERELNSKAYFAKPSERLIIAVTPPHTMAAAVMWAKRYESQIKKLKE